MVFHSIIFKSGVKKIVNLSLARTIELDKNIITINFPPSYNGFFIFGGGGINCKKVQEEIKYDNEDQANVGFFEIQEKLLKKENK